MIILRRRVAVGMIGLSIFLFLIAVTLNGYSATLNVAEVTFAINFLAIFSVLFMAVGIYLISNKHTQRKPLRRGHHFNTAYR